MIRAASSTGICVQAEVQPEPVFGDPFVGDVVELLLAHRVDLLLRHILLLEHPGGKLRILRRADSGNHVLQILDLIDEHSDARSL